MTETIEAYKSSLAEAINQIIGENTSLAIGLMGVGIGWEPSGAKRFEVRISTEVDDDTLALLPTTYLGFSINYEKTGKISME